MNVSNLPQPSLESTYLPIALNISLYLLYQFCIAKPPNVRWKIKSPWAQAHCIYATVSPSAITIVHHRIYVSTGWFRCCLFKWRTSNLRSLCSCLRKRKPNTPTNRKKAPYVICCVVCWAGEAPKQHRNNTTRQKNLCDSIQILFKYYARLLKADINQNNSMLCDAQTDERQSTHSTTHNTVHNKKNANRNSYFHRENSGLSE